MRTTLISLVLIVSTACFGQNFIIRGNTEYKGCNSLGKVTLSSNPSEDSILYIMSSNDCNIPLRPPQYSTIFDSLPPCHYSFKAFKKNGDSAKMSIKVGLQFTALFTTPCDSNSQIILDSQPLFTSFKIYNTALNGNESNNTLNPPYTLQVKERGIVVSEYRFESLDTNIFTIIYDHDVTKGPYFYLTDGCGDSDSSLYKGLLEFPTLQLQKDCNNNYILESSINNAYTNFPNSPFTYKWFQNGLLLNDTSSSLVFNMFNPNDQFRSVINYDRCVFVSEKIQSIDTSSSLLDYRLEKSNAALCRNDSVNLKIVNQGLSDIKVSWDTGSFTDSTWVYKPGFYKAFIENDLGCRDTLLVEIKSSDPRLIANKQDNKCFAAFSSSIDINLSGGIFPFRYTWSDSVFIEDRINIRNGTYWLHISDSIGCTLDTTFTITSPTSLGLNLTAHAASCAPARDGKVTSSVTGGKPPYDIHWSNGLKVYDVDTLSVGIYTITVTDSNLCTTAFTFSIDDLSPLRGNSIDTICAGGSLSIGSKKYSSPGRYIDTLTSVKGCDSVHITNLTINPAVDFILMAKDPSCNGLEDGIISLTNITGFPGYTYFLNDNQVSPDILEGLKSGNYTVKLQDRFGCFKEKGIALSNAEKIE
ncbi:MAG: SprB repeat-containing protein, partial [Saprospiraceae bacterium]